MSSRDQPAMIHVACVSIKESVKALRFRFLPTPEATCSQHQTNAIFWDGKRLLRTSAVGTSKGNLEKIKKGESYIIKNCRVTDSGFLNFLRDSKIFLSSKIEVPQDQIQQGEAMLFPISPLVAVEDLANSAPELFSLSGKIVKLSQIMCRGDNVPLREITISSSMGEEVQLAMWRECALEIPELNRHYTFTHLRMKDYLSYGRKCCSTVHTRITVADNEEQVQVEVKGLGEENGCLLLVTEMGKEVSIPKEVWNGEILELSKHLPFSVHVFMKEGEVFRVNGLPGSEE
ncbi:uncharacterized protein LOC114853844 isoform X2 [Betta splendens]|nr:uncharacterized protein LOC114853844 isoform X2 [Betta splendens]